MGIESAGITAAVTELAKIVRETAGIVIDPLRKVTTSAVDIYIEKKRATAKFENDVDELYKRAELRRIEMEIQRQYNFEQICHNAVGNLSTNATPEKVNKDWLHNFFNVSQDISEDELQKIWGNILAQECNSPKSISKLTLEKLKVMSAEDCKLFSVFVERVVEASNRKYSILLKFRDYTNFNDLYNFDFSDFSHLCDLGLINNSDIAVFDLPSNGYLDIQLPEKGMIYLENKGSKSYKLNFYLLTSAGKEIKKIIKPRYNDVYFGNLFRFLSTENIHFSKEISQFSHHTNYSFLTGRKPD